MTDKIIIIDDEQVIVDITMMILRNKGYEVLGANCAVEGLHLIEQHCPSLVLLDYMMPVMDGMETLKSIRRDFPDVAVIMFTGKGGEEVAVELMKAGASDYVLKPFSNQDLVDRIDNVLRIRRVELLNRELSIERERLIGEIERWNQTLESRVEEKGRELERVQSEIIQAEKLAALGHISAGLAHEIRNPLNSIALFAQILKSVLKDDPESAGYTEKIAREVDRIDGILIKLLDVSKTPRTELSECNLCTVVTQSLDSFEDQISVQNVCVKKQGLDFPLHFVGDPSELELVFNNLFANALYEMKEGGKLGVAAEIEDGQFRIIVSDTGRGIPAEKLREIFDPFFSTKKSGTGFGLSVVLRVVRNHGGRIDVESRQGEGTRFLVQLPRHNRV